MLFIIQEAVVISQPWGCWFSSLFSIMLMEKLMCRNEAVDFAGIARTQECQAPPQVFALSSCSCQAGQNALDPWP